MIINSGVLHNPAMFIWVTPFFPHKKNLKIQNKKPGKLIKKQLEQLEVLN